MYIVKVINTNTKEVIFEKSFLDERDANAYASRLNATPLFGKWGKAIVELV